MKSVRWTIMKDEAELSTLLLIGAGFQALLVVLLPPYVAILPACVLLLYRAAYTFLIHQGFLPNPRLENVTSGKLWATFPTQDSASSEKAPKNNLVLFIIGARSQQ